MKLFLTKVILSIIILSQFAACKSVAYRAKQDDAKNEIYTLIKEMNDNQTRKTDLTTNLFSYTSSNKMIDKDKLDALFNSFKQFKKVNNQILDKKINKRRIKKYFAQQTAFSNSLSIFIKILHKKESLRKDRHLMELFSQLEGVENRINFVSEKYNKAMEQYKKYLNYPTIKVVRYFY